MLSFVPGERDRTEHETMSVVVCKCVSYTAVNPVVPLQEKVEMLHSSLGLFRGVATLFVAHTTQHSSRSIYSNLVCT